MSEGLVQLRTAQGGWVALNPAAVVVAEAWDRVEGKAVTDERTRVEMVNGRVLVLAMSYDAFCRRLGARIAGPQPQLPLLESVA